MTALEAGRALDALIAEKVLGLPVRRDWPCMTPGGEYFAYEPELAELHPMLGINVTHFSERDHAVDVLIDGEYIDRYRVPDYSTDGAAAGHVCESLRSRGWFVEVTLRPAPYNDCEVVVCDGFDSHRLPVRQRAYESAPTVALAICRAALRALGVDTIQENGDG